MDHQHDAHQHQQQVVTYAQTPTHAEVDMHDGGPVVPQGRQQQNHHNHQQQHTNAHQWQYYQQYQHQHHQQQQYQQQHQQQHPGPSHRRPHQQHFQLQEQHQPREDYQHQHQQPFTAQAQQHLHHASHIADAVQQQNRLSTSADFFAQQQYFSTQQVHPTQHQPAVGQHQQHAVAVGYHHQHQQQHQWRPRQRQQSLQHHRQQQEELQYSHHHQQRARPSVQPAEPQQLVQVPPGHPGSGSGDDMQQPAAASASSLKHTICLDCGRRRRTYGFADGKALWCASCALRHPGAQSLQKQKMCTDCTERQPNYGYLSDGRRRWCKACAQKPVRMLANPSRGPPVLLHQQNKCEDCHQRQSFYGMPDENRRRWCARCGKANHPGSRSIMTKKKRAELEARYNLGAADGDAGDLSPGSSATVVTDGGEGGGDASGAGMAPQLEPTEFYKKFDESLQPSEGKRKRDTSNAAAARKRLEKAANSKVSTKKRTCRVPSGYNLFMREELPRRRAEHMDNCTDASQRQVFREAAAEWKALDSARKQEYTKASAQMHQIKAERVRALKRAPTAYNIFVQAKFSRAPKDPEDQLVADGTSGGGDDFAAVVPPPPPKVTQAEHKDRFRQAAAEWKAMGPDDRQVYEVMRQKILLDRQEMLVEHQQRMDAVHEAFEQQQEQGVQAATMSPVAAVAVAAEALAARGPWPAVNPIDGCF